MSEVISIDPHQDHRYREFLEKHPEATIFHDPVWMRVLETSYGFRQSSFACLDGERMTGLLPLLEINSPLTGRRGVSLPFSDYCVPLAGSSSVTARFVAHCESFRRERGWKSVEFRWAIEGGSGLADGGHFKRHRLNLDADSKKVLATFDKSRTQLSIKKFQKTGGTSERRTDWEAMRAFMKLNYVTRRKHGIPPQPDRFFHHLWDLIIRPGNGFVCVARLGERVLAASVFLLFKDTVYYKYSASDESMLQYAPNYGVLWQAISWACENGYRCFDFGRTDLVDEGLLRFKRRWGTEETDISYTRLGAGAVTSSESPLDVLKPVLRRTPVPVLKFLGRILYAHIG